MKPSQPIFLKPGWTVVVDGVEMSYEEIMDAKIDSIMYRRHLEKLMAEADSQ